MVNQLIELGTEVTDNALNFPTLLTVKVGQLLLSVVLGFADTLFRLVSFMLMCLYLFENCIEFLHALSHLCITVKIIG